MLYINKTQQKNGQKAAASSSSRKLTLQGLRTLEATAVDYNAMLPNRIQPEIS